MSVDLPAPFSPMSAWTVPARTAKDTSASACTPGNDLEMCCISSTNGASPEGAGNLIAPSDLSLSLRPKAIPVYLTLGGPDCSPCGVYFPGYYFLKLLKLSFVTFWYG